jgi:hypothetical protein
MVGGDDVPQLKQHFSAVLGAVLLEMNRISKGGGDSEALRTMFLPDAFRTFEQYALLNKAATIRTSYEPQMIARQKGEYYDIRSVTVRVVLGGTQASDLQSLIFTFSKGGKIVSVRSVLPNYDYQSVIARGTSPRDSLTRGLILDFLERFRIAYNTKDIDFLEKVYSEEAVIIVGTILKEKEGADDYMRRTLLSPAKVKLIQLSKQEYLEGLRQRAFKQNAFINVRFEDLEILQHEKIPYIYGVTCKQEWRSSGYTDTGYLFLMMDFRVTAEPVIHVRSWQPKAFDDGTFVGLYDFDVVEYH